MKFINEKKVYSMFEVTKASSYSRSFLLELEENKIIEPFYKDKNTSYRYYDESIFVKLNEISLLLNAGLTKKDIKDFYINNKEDDSPSLIKKESRNSLISSLKEKRDDIDTSLLFLSSLVNKTYKKKTKKIIYYYEERNINNIEMISSLLKEIYIHALAKNYYFTNENPFIIFQKDVISIDSIFSNKDQFIKIKICIPIKKNYKEKNIDVIKEGVSLIYEINKTSFEKSFNNLKEIIASSSTKIKNDIIYQYFDDNNILKINRFIIPL